MFVSLFLCFFVCHLLPCLLVVCCIMYTCTLQPTHLITSHELFLLDCPSFVCLFVGLISSLVCCLLPHVHIYITAYSLDSFS